MKTRFKQIPLLMAISALGIIASCGDDSGKIVVPSDLSIEFNSAGASVIESAAAITVTLEFLEAPDDVTVTANVSGTAAYTTHYTTSPAVANDEISIDIANGETSATFTLTPVDNSEVDGSRTAIFTLVAATGIDLGTNATYTVTITDDETAKVVTSIADLRAMYTDTEVLFLEDVYIQGVIISDLDVNGDQNMTIQDATAGITIRLTDGEANMLVRGQEVEINVNGAALDVSYFDLLQVTGDPANEATYSATLLAAAIEDLGTGTLPTPTTITMVELENGDHESELVSVTGVTFPGADGTTTYSIGNSHEISDGTTSSLYRANGTTFEDDLVPFGTGDLTGIASIFNNRQLIAQIDGDQFANQPTTTIAVTPNGTNDFGMLEAGLTSASQSYTVDLTDAIVDVTATPPSGYEVSLDDVTFTTEAVVLTAAASSTLYARFAPTSGIAGEKRGDLVFTAAGAFAAEVTLTGEETVAVPPVFIETFETDGNGTRYTTSMVEFSDDAADYFLRTDGSDIASFIEYSGAQGFFFAANDIDAANEGGSGGSTSATFDVAGIDISGATNLMFSIFLAEDDEGTNQDWDEDTELIIQYQIDGGGYQNLIAVQAKELRDDGTTSTTNKAPAIDTNFDGIGDGTEITSDFTEFMASIPETGALLDIRINMNVLDSGDEDIAFDNIQVTGN